MTVVRRDQLRTMMGMVLLSDIGFWSLDFSELALRVNQDLGTELNFDAPGLRSTYLDLTVWCGACLLYTSPSPRDRS